MIIEKFLREYKKEKRRFSNFSLKPYFQFCKDLLKIKEKILENYSISDTCVKKLENLDIYLKKEGVLAFVGGSYFFGCPTEESDIDCYILFPRGFSDEGSVEDLMNYLEKQYEVSFFGCISEISALYYLADLYLLRFMTKIIGDKCLYWRILFKNNFSFFRFEKGENLILPIHKDFFWSNENPKKAFLDVLRTPFLKYLTRINNEKEKDNLSKIIDRHYNSWLNALEKDKRTN